VPRRADIDHRRVAERRIVDLAPRQVAACACGDRRHQPGQPRALVPPRHRIAVEPGRADRRRRDRAHRHRQAARAVTAVAARELARTAAHLGARAHRGHDARDHVRQRIVLAAFVVAALTRDHRRDAHSRARLDPRGEDREDREHRDHEQPPRGSRPNVARGDPPERRRLLGMVRRLVRAAGRDPPSDPVGDRPTEPDGQGDDRATEPLERIRDPAEHDAEHPRELRRLVA